MKKIIDKELEKNAPVLASLKKTAKTPPTDLPESFFLDIQSMVLENLKTEKNRERKGSNAKIVRLSLFKWSVAMAASIAALVAIFFYFSIDKPNEFNTKTNLVDLSESDILGYIDQNIDEFDEISILELTDKTSKGFLSNTSETKDWIDEYLIENIDELDDSIFDELF